MIKVFLAVPALVIAMNAGADCQSGLPTEVPSMPEGATATRLQIEQAQVDAQAYVDSVAAFLDCPRKEVSDMKHNFFVDSAFQTAKKYNQTLIRFNQRAQSLASN
jgi:hypothetical protein